MSALTAMMTMMSAQMTKTDVMSTKMDEMSTKMDIAERREATRSLLRAEADDTLDETLQADIAERRGATRRSLLRAVADETLDDLDGSFVLRPGSMSTFNEEAEEAEAEAEAEAEEAEDEEDLVPVEVAAQVPAGMSGLVGLIVVGLYCIVL